MFPLCIGGSVAFWQENQIANHETRTLIPARTLLCFVASCRQLFILSSGQSSHPKVGKDRLCPGHICVPGYSVTPGGTAQMGLP